MSPLPPEEVELKLSVPPEDAAAVWEHPAVARHARGTPSVKVLDSVYFDTADLDLARCGLVLRLRKAGESIVQTVKTRDSATAGLFRRGEWEVPIDGDVPQLARIRDRKLRGRIEAAVGDAPLVPILRTHVQRSTRMLEGADWAIRFDLDDGEAKTPKGSLPISELELELVRGDPSSLYDLARELHEDIPLRAVSLGKAEAGMALLLGDKPQPRRMGPVEVAPDATLEDVMVAVFACCVSHIVANEAPARAGVDPEGVHQVRVGARRLRSALALFSELLPGDDRQQLRDELRWLAGELADARDLDVFLAETLEPILSETAECDELVRLERVVHVLRAAGYTRARAALDSRRYTQLVLSLGAWLAGRRWRDQSLTPESARLFAPARATAESLLTRRYEKVRGRSSDVRELSPEDAHRLRIELKKLRYAGEFLRGLYPERHAGRFLKRIGRLQDVLGHLNDQRAAQSVLTRALAQGLGSSETAITPWSVGFVSGWSSRVALDKLRSLEKAWKAFAKLDPFWLAD